MFKTTNAFRIILLIVMSQFLGMGLSYAQQVHSPADSLRVALTSDSLYNAFDHAWWRYSLVDDSAFATPGYNDSSWKYIQSQHIDTTLLKGIGWFRLHFTIDTSMVRKPIAFLLKQKGASEIYLDGKLVKRYGKINGKDSTEYYDPQNVPVILVMDSIGHHVLAIRYARYRFRDENIGFSIGMEHANSAIENKRTNDVVITIFLMVLFVIFITLGFLHVLFFLYYKQNLSNLWFSIFMFCIAGIWFSIFWSNYTGDPDWAETLKNAIVVCACLACASFVFFIHILFANKRKLWLIIAFLLCATTLGGYFSDAFEFGMVLAALLIYAAVYTSVCLLRAIIRKIQGALILGVGFGFFMVSLFCIILLSIVMNGVEINTGSSLLGQILAIIILLDIVSIPLTMSIYQAWMFAKLNRDLTTQLQQVQQLSEKTIQQEQEKNKLISSQNEMLEQKVEERTFQLQTEKKKSDALLRNILPDEVAEELKNTGTAEARQYNNVSVLFTDFVNFTGLSERMTPTELVQEIHRNFTAFDSIIEKHGLEKIKTIGDAYMAVCGLPIDVPDHAQRVVRAAKDIVEYMNTGNNTFKIRIGIHSGPVVAGIVGVKKYAYDIWGDTVNTAARMEQNSESGKINISGATYELVKREFTCEHRGKMNVKNKGEIDMYFVGS